MIPQVLYTGMSFDEFLLVIDPPEAPIVEDPAPIEDNYFDIDQSE